MVFHVTSVNLSEPSVTLKAYTNSSLVPLSVLAPPNAIAGINGGYFFRLDKKHFIDDVCFFKTRAQAEQPVSAEHANYGAGDGLVMRDGTLLSSNCDCIGYDVPALLVMNGTNSKVVLQTRGAKAIPGLVDGIAAGPNLVSEDSNGKPYVNIPSHDHNVNIKEHSANTVVVLRRDPTGKFMQEMLFVTADGHDGCPSSDVTCGIDAPHMAYFSLDYLGAAQAMEMDQGGSTTMWVSGLGVVSNPGSGERHIFSGLYVVANK